MRDPKTLFWKPRGDAEVYGLDGDTVMLSLVLANYGGEESYPPDRFNRAEFVALQCLVGFWEDVRYLVAIQSPRATDEMRACASDAKVTGLFEPLSALIAEKTETSWAAFDKASRVHVRNVSLEKSRPDHYTLAFSVDDEALTRPLQVLTTWCLG